jgi:hypothetical protein
MIKTYELIKIIRFNILFSVIYGFNYLILLYKLDELLYMKNLNVFFVINQRKFGLNYLNCLC